MTCYISGPMTGIAAFNFPAFHQAAANLRARGYTVVNPAELDELHPSETLQWSDYLRRDIKALMDCTHIAMLQGHETSKGACLELFVASALGMPVMYLNERGDLS